MLQLLMNVDRRLGLAWHRSVVPNVGGFALVS